MIFDLGYCSSLYNLPVAEFGCWAPDFYSDYLRNDPENQGCTALFGLFFFRSESKPLDYCRLLHDINLYELQLGEFTM